MCSIPAGSALAPPVLACVTQVLLRERHTLRGAMNLQQKAGLAQATRFDVISPRTSCPGFGIELIFFLVAGIVQWFGFSRKRMLITH